MRILLAGLLFWGLALGQAVVKGLTPAEVEGILKQAGLAYEKTDAQEFRLEMAGLTKVWLYLDFCQEGRCGVLTLSAGFTLDEVPDLEAVNAWNRDRRFSRAFLDEEGTVWVESDLDLTGGVSLGAVRAFLDLFAEEILPDFMDHIGFKP
ncbi:YbjN domain-containing protein [Thermus scotoductus]|uniref:YbjN domain-containing protein n=1 Tax=Thermus scotoductus TaxID=37636 RepID=A0A430SBG6_THESC|nr:YbjN domain-containing protein [Thermus scotoductus]RTG95740.1 YbjN domain-containing protein [Thermus scotoductus]RTH09691.1 YbjN domain-containing protein [Thermus scotoductus]RTH10997.1 YbjN domain-containing protein [Thermus scotoductus]RTH13085.1 YbjN domain-containing protein [Thermus scotoductus]RTH16359.1 YbjN domain-containing protein [Thermus scotoductus]